MENDPLIQPTDDPALLVVAKAIFFEELNITHNPFEAWDKMTRPQRERRYDVARVAISAYLGFQQKSEEARKK